MYCAVGCHCIMHFIFLYCICYLSLSSAELISRRSCNPLFCLSLACDPPPSTRSPVGPSERALHCEPTSSARRVRTKAFGRFCLSIGVRHGFAGALLGLKKAVGTCRRDRIRKMGTLATGDLDPAGIFCSAFGKSWRQWSKGFPIIQMSTFIFSDLTFQHHFSVKKSALV